MPGQEKPYRVYRTGRGRPRLPAGRRRERPPGRLIPRQQRQRKPPRSTRRRVARWLGIGIAVFLLWLAAWGLAGYFSFRDGVEAANDRLPESARKQLESGGGLPATSPSTILLLGTDSAPGEARRGLRHSDSIMLVRTDPDHHRLAYLSIPRDLYVDIPSYGTARINTAFQAGGAALTLRTVRRLTGLELNHVVIVDFRRFRDLIDAIGGIDVKVPRPIRSNRFDCPYDAQRCRTWHGWRFAKGKQHMDGRRALVYTRIRENQLDPAENDLTRAERQQQVLQAISDKLAGFGTFLRLPFSGGDLLEPLATDLSAGELLQLGWVKFRADDGDTLHCRLGGDAELVDGASVIRSSDLNRNVLSMFTGDAAPQPPPPGTGTFGPGCVVGNRTLGSR